jgi:hypothetical protein
MAGTQAELRPSTPPRAKSSPSDAPAIGFCRSSRLVDELKYLATYDGDPGEFRTPATLIDFARQVAMSDEPLGGATADISPEVVPVKPGDPYWPSFQAGAHEVWESSGRS